MQRRDFLKLSSALSLPLLINGIPLSAAANNQPLLQLLREQSIDNGRVLVLIQMNGGNDGLNTLIPLDQYDKLVNARSNIVIPSNKVLPLNGLPQTGMNPAMSGMQALFNNGQMNIVQGVSYPNPNFSHFRATDILFSGSASNENLHTGWIGRTLSTTYPGYPAAYINNPNMPDPLAVQIGSQTSLLTQCDTGSTAMIVNDPNYFFNLINGVSSDTPDTPYGHELTFVRLIKQQTNAYTSTIRNAYNRASNLVSYPSDNSLAEQLKIVACLVKGGLKTPVYIVSHQGSFDTHANQADITDTTKGKHAGLLEVLSSAVSAFQQDLVAMGISDRVATMTSTEFGRRIKSNDSMGTDHGTATPVFFFGSQLNPVIVGSNPLIPDNATPSDQVPMQNDFRAVYYTIIKDWFMLTDAQLSDVFPTPYNTLPIFKQLQALPVKLLSFTGKWLTGKVNLQWEVDQESGISNYEVQRSDDGNNFAKIGTVTATGSSVSYTYNFDDLYLSKTLYYYRIKIIEQSGSSSFSSVILLKTNQASAGIAVKIFPNPVSDYFTVALGNAISGPVTVRIIDLTGKEIWKQEKEISNAFNIRFSFAGKKPVAGIYALKVQAKKEETTLKILVQ